MRKRFKIMKETIYRCSCSRLRGDEQNMMMTPEEIRREYNDAKFKSKQIGILADLNRCGKGEIIKILQDQGVEIKKPGKIHKKEEPKKTEAAKPVSEDDKNSSDAQGPAEKEKEQAQRQQDKKGDQTRPGIPQCLQEVIALKLAEIQERHRAISEIVNDKRKELIEAETELQKYDRQLREINEYLEDRKVRKGTQI